MFEIITATIDLDKPSLKISIEGFNLESILSTLSGSDSFSSHIRSQGASIEFRRDYNFRTVDHYDLFTNESLQIYLAGLAFICTLALDNKKYFWDFFEKLKKLGRALGRSESELKEALKQKMNSMESVNMLLRSHATIHQIPLDEEMYKRLEMDFTKTVEQLEEIVRSRSEQNFKMFRFIDNHNLHNCKTYNNKAALLTVEEIRAGEEILELRLPEKSCNSLPFLNYNSGLDSIRESEELTIKKCSRLIHFQSEYDHFNSLLKHFILTNFFNKSVSFDRQASQLQLNLLEFRGNRSPIHSVLVNRDLNKQEQQLCIKALSVVERGFWFESRLNNSDDIKVLECVHIKSYDDETPLQSAVKEGNEQAAKTILCAGGRVNDRCNASLVIENDTEYTALHIASIKNNLDLVLLLVSHGADVNSRTKNGKKASDLCTDKNIKDYLKLASKKATAASCGLFSSCSTINCPELSSYEGFLP